MHHVGNDLSALPKARPLLEPAVADHLVGVGENPLHGEGPLARRLRCLVREPQADAGALGELRQDHDEFIVGDRERRRDDAVLELQLLACLVVHVESLGIELRVINTSAEDAEDLEEHRQVRDIPPEVVLQNHVHVVRRLLGVDCCAECQDEHQGHEAGQPSPLHYRFPFMCVA